MAESRESLKTRLGFLALSAGCTIGLGNVWRFPYVTGVYGGGAFLLIYLIFLLILGYPLLMLELALGRGSRSGLLGAYRTLAGKHGKWWSGIGSVFFLGNLLLLMFYTTVTGWLLYYSFSYVAGDISVCLTAQESKAFFDQLVYSPVNCVWSMAVCTVFSGVVCAVGLQKGVEKVVSWLMAVLFGMLVIMALGSLTLSGAGEAMKFYLIPDFERMMSRGIVSTVYAAMGQAFFTLSIGIGSMVIFGSYIDRSKALSNESAWIIALDTLVAFLAGVIIFPVCFTFGVDVTSGPGLVFVSLPTVFNQLPFPQLIGGAFFIFLLLAAITTLIAVIENLVAFGIDELKLTRKVSTLLVTVILLILSLPCSFAGNLLAHIKPMGKDILDFEDFLVSQNLLPLGALFACIFVISRYGWGWENLLAEVNSGRGYKITYGKWYVKWVLPLLILAVFICGYCF